ncbi:MAG: hypothetical protein AAGI07_16280 [Bacteroidota bacterium]
MTSFRVRPRFKQEVQIASSEVQARIYAVVEKNAGLSSTKAIPGYITLRIRPKDRHYWSPQLNLTFEENETGNTIIRGLYGPNPQIWTLIFFGYAVLSVAAFFILMIGLSQLSLDKDSSILWALIVVGILAGLLYFISQLGQKLGAEQTFLLHHAFEEAVGDKVRIV